jgi:hypothetical protein
VSPPLQYPTYPRGASDAFDNWHRVAGKLQPLKVERDREQPATEGIHEVACRDIPAVAPAFDERFLFRGSERLHDHVRPFPTIGGGAAGEGEQHVSPARQHVRIAHRLTVSGADQYVWCTATGRHTHDALRGLAKDDAFRPLAHAGRLVCRRNCDGGAPR